jgi:thymidylate synthase (FAD)
VTEDTHLGPGVYGGLETHRGRRENCSAPDCGNATELDITDDVVVELVKEVAEDADVVMAARVSTGGRQDLLSIRHDEKRTAGLINYLMRDRHGSPFEHNSMTFFIQAPIFVFREFHRHRVGWSYNEESGRYKELAPTFYLPGRERPLQQVGKPGAYQYVAGTAEQYEVMEEELMATYTQAWRSYQRMLGVGIAREVARLSLPVGVFSSMYATCNARSLMHFLSLRTKDERARIKSGPQWEIDKLVARQMENAFARLMPATYKAFNDNGRVAP